MVSDAEMKLILARSPRNDEKITKNEIIGFHQNLLEYIIEQEVNVYSLIQNDVKILQNVQLNKM